MADVYKVTLGEMRYSGDVLRPGGIHVGNFVISFTVEPPVKFVSEQAVAEMGQHVLAAWNTIGRDRYAEIGREMPGMSGNQALVSFTHEVGEGDAGATKGIVKGYGDAHPDRFGREALQEAFDIVLNGESET